MNTNDNQSRKAEQGRETTTTESPERVLLREILEALDLPWAADYDHRDPRLQLLADRVAFIRGYVGSALTHDSVADSVPGLARSVTKYHPVAYKVYGGES